MHMQQVTARGLEPHSLHATATRANGAEVCIHCLHIKCCRNLRGVVHIHQSIVPASMRPSLFSLLSRRPPFVIRRHVVSWYGSAS